MIATVRGTVPHQSQDKEIQIMNKDPYILLWPGSRVEITTDQHRLVEAWVIRYSAGCNKYLLIDREDNEWWCSREEMTIMHAFTVHECLEFELTDNPKGPRATALRFCQHALCVPKDAIPYLQACIHNVKLSGADVPLLLEAIASFRRLGGQQGQ
jgi:hypothetical protein